MSKKKIYSIEKVIGLLSLAIGTYVALIQDCVSYKWVLGFAFAILGSWIITLVALRKENDTD